MSLSIPPQITVPFADAGLKVAIPANSDNVTGRAGYNQGFPPINMTPKVAGGIPPFGTDMNGILYDATRGIQFLEAGNGFVYNSAYATAIGGYRPGARVLRSDGFGYWINTVDGNTTDPEAVGGAAAGWRPDFTAGSSAVTMTNANVTLTPLQFGRPVIVITGTLTANVSLIFPNIVGQWVVLNNTTGSFTITCRTAAGSGVVAAPPLGSTAIFGDGTNIYSATTLASAAEAQGYSNLTKLLTPGTLNAAFQGANQNLSGTVWQRLPGGVLIQSGTLSAATSGTLVFPVAYSSSTNYRVFIQADAVAGTFSTSVNRSSASQFTYIVNASTSIHWYSIGF